MTSVIIGNGVTSIGRRTFYNCTSLTSVTIGNGVTSIDKQAFENCYRLTTIYCLNTIPPTCSDLNTFQCSTDYVRDKYDVYNYAVLHVPIGSKESYSSAYVWRYFNKIYDDIEIDGTDPNPGTKKCDTPTISYANGKLTFNSETEDVVFHSSITDSDITSYLTHEIELSVTYIIDVYATKEGYDKSDVATGTLCWVEQQPATENITDEDAVTEVKAMPVLIQSQGGNITIQGAAKGTPIAIYSIDGKQYGSAIAEKDSTTIATSLQPGSVAIVKIGERAVKVLVK